MPLFEYRCRECDHHFELLVRESTRYECPKCASDELDKQLSVFAVSAPSQRRHDDECRTVAVRRVRRPARRGQLPYQLRT